MTLQLTDRPGRGDFVAVAAQTTFAVPFEFADPDDLLVYRNGLLLTRALAPADITEYAVTGADVAIIAGGGTVTLGAGCTAGDKVAIVSNVQVRRLTDFPLTGPFRVAALNNEVERIYSLLRQLEASIQSRVLRAPDSDPAVDLVIPALGVRNGRVLGFDLVTGNPVVGPLLSDLQLYLDIVLGSIEDGSVRNLTVTEDAYIQGDLLVAGMLRILGNFVVDGDFQLLVPLGIESGGLGSRTVEEARTALGLGDAALLDVADLPGLSLSAKLAALDALGLADGNMIRATGADTFDVVNSTPFGRALLNLVDESALSALSGSGFSAVDLDANGYVRFGNGFTIQWGSFFLGTDGTLDISYPVAFTTFGIPQVSIGGDRAAGAGGSDNLQISNATPPTVSGFRVVNDGLSGTHYWIAVGV